jgi:hypothetical protein
MHSSSLSGQSNLLVALESSISLSSVETSMKLQYALKYEVFFFFEKKIGSINSKGNERLLKWNASWLCS